MKINDTYIQKTTITNEVYKKIREMILNGELKPGEALIQEKLAQKFCISRTPLMHALRELENDGLLIRNHNYRIYVRKFSLEELIVIFEIREGLEKLACRYVTPIITQKQIDDFKRRFSEALKREDYNDYRILDNDFHMLIAELCPSRDLKTLLIKSGFMSKALVKGLIRPPEETYQEHIKILEGFEKRNPREAEKKMAIHIIKSIRKLRSMRRSNSLT